MASKRTLVESGVRAVFSLLGGCAPGCTCPTCEAGARFGLGLARGVAKVAGRRARRRRGGAAVKPEGNLESGEPVAGELVELVERVELPRRVEVVVTAVRPAPPSKPAR